MLVGVITPSQRNDLRMSNKLKQALEEEGYDELTANEIVKIAENFEDEDSVKKFLLEMIQDQTKLKNYLNSRSSSQKPSVSSMASTAVNKATREKQKFPKGEKKVIHLEKPVIQNVNFGLKPNRQGNKGWFGRSSSAASIRDAPSLDEVRKKNLETQKKLQNEHQKNLNNLKDIDTAIRNLEINAKGGGTRKACDCIGAKHGLLKIAPNCLNCGRVICNQEGVGPCIYCGTRIISNEALNEIRIALQVRRSDTSAKLDPELLKHAGINLTIDERGRISQLDQFEKAMALRDTILEHQASGLSRTKINDEFSSYDFSNDALNKWATLLEQAQQIQQLQRYARKDAKRLDAQRQPDQKVFSIRVTDKKNVESRENSETNALPITEEPDIDSESNDDEDGPEDTQLTFHTYFDAKSYCQNWDPPKYETSKNKEFNYEVNCSSKIQYDEDQILNF